MQFNPNANSATEMAQENGTTRRTVIGIVTTADHEEMGVDHPVHIDAGLDGVVV